MDMSIIESEARPANVNEVTEYGAEIHTHLRDVEVCFMSRPLDTKLWVNGNCCLMLVWALSA